MWRPGSHRSGRRWASLRRTETTNPTRSAYLSVVWCPAIPKASLPPRLAPRLVERTEEAELERTLRALPGREERKSPGRTISPGRGELFAVCEEWRLPAEVGRAALRPAACGWLRSGSRV
eukprot:scaffold58805_cov25-Tisochrysis_lutea.AAC.7